MVNFIIESIAFGPLERPCTVSEVSSPKLESGSDFDIVASSVTSTTNAAVDKADAEALVVVIVDVTVALVVVVVVVVVAAVVVSRSGF